MNEKPLATVLEATARTHYYSPLVPPRNERGSTGLVNSLLPGAQACRAVAAALTARAMLLAGHGRADDAWRDLLACHRLARLVGRGGTLIEGLVGSAIDQITYRADVAFLLLTNLDAKQVEGCLRDLQAFPVPPDVAEKVNLDGRFTLLDIMMLVDRDGIEFLQNMGGNKKSEPGDGQFGDAMFEGIDWDPALVTVNRWYDRVADLLRERSRVKRASLLNEFSAEFQVLKDVALRQERLAEMLADGQEPAKAKGQAVGDIFVIKFMPAFEKVMDGADRTRQAHDNTVVAFALAWHQRENGRYPERLDVLAPKYLKQVPPDLFSGDNLIYRPSAEGYLLYSVGVNGIDDGGRSHGDQPPGDDLVVRVPPPAQ